MAMQKKKNSKKEKNIIPKYYAGTDARKLPKVPKAMLTDLKDMEKLVMSPEQREALLSAIALGLIPDKFGLEAGLDQKIKAIAELNKMQLAKSQFDQEEKENEQISSATDFLFAIKKASGGINK
ncbi:MAG: hypothetical protein ACI35S_05320 [Anaeroplasma sp.]